MSENTISNEEWNTLIKLGKDIQVTFIHGDPNGHGVPTEAEIEGTLNGK